MSFFRRRGQRSGLHPVMHIKHVVDVQGGLLAGTQLDTNIITAVESPSLANVKEVEIGHTVNGIYLKVEIVATSSAALSNAYMMVYKDPGGNTTPPQANAVGASDNKRFSIHQEMIMLQKQDGSNPRTLFNGVIVLPRGMRRFAANDLLIVSILCPGITADFCIQVHFKEFG